MPWGELAALGTAVCWSFTAVFFSFAGRVMGSPVVNRSRLIFAFLLLALSHRLVEGSFFPTGVEPFRWGWLGVSSLLGLVLGDAFLFQAFVLLGPRLSTLLMSTVPVYSTLFGWLLFDEVLAPVELLGVCLTVAGVAWVVTEKQPGLDATQSRAYKTGLLFGMLGALGQVANLVTARYGLVGGFSSLSATIMRILIALVVLWGFAAVRGRIGHTVRQWGHRRAFAALLGGAVAGPFLGIWLSLIAIQQARLGIASTLMALPPVILIPIEYLVYRRRVSRRSMAGTAVAMLGVALLFDLFSTG